MAHVRKQIRDAVLTLITNLASSGGRAFAGRVSPYAEDELPAVNVRVGDETITQSSIHYPAVLLRELEVSIESVVKLTDQADDDLDAMALEVEGAIAASSSTVTLSGLLNCALTPTGIVVEREDQGEVPIGRLTLAYRTQYEVMNNAADTAL